MNTLIFVLVHFADMFKVNPTISHVLHPTSEEFQRIGVLSQRGNHKISTVTDSVASQQSVWPKQPGPVNFIHAAFGVFNM